jgi:DNA replication protein DnaC
MPFIQNEVPLRRLRNWGEIEQRERESRNLASRTRMATLGPFSTLDHFDWNHPRKIDRNLFESLHGSLDFIDRGENVLLRGPCGVGKTMLAKNLGLATLSRGYTVRFSTLAATLTDLLQKESLPAFERCMKHRYLASKLLIIDEIGFLPCDSRSADLLYNIVNRRHEHRSLVLTTNLPFKQWGTIFPGSSCVAALVDRFIHHCHIIDIEADSWRQKNSMQVAKKKAK